MPTNPFKFPALQAAPVYQGEIVSDSHPRLERPSLTPEQQRYIEAGRQAVQMSQVGLPCFALGIMCSVIVFGLIEHYRK